MQSIRQLAREKKENEFDYPELEGFKVKLCLLSNNYIQKLISESTKQVLDKTTYKTKEEFDKDKFIELFTKEVVVGWTGLKAKYLPSLMPADIEDVEDKEAELEFSYENAVDLMTHSGDFERWVNVVTSELSNFNKPRSNEK